MMVLLLVDGDVNAVVSVVVVAVAIGVLAAAFTIAIGDVFVVPVVVDEFCYWWLVLLVVVNDAVVVEAVVVEAVVVDAVVVDAVSIKVLVVAVTFTFGGIIVVPAVSDVAFGG